MAGFDYGTIRAKLQQMVQENKLQHFYPPQRLDQVAQQLTTKDIKGLGHRWRLPSEVNLDLVTLALYDVVIWADDSTSMSALDNGERIKDMKAILGRVADAATLFDDDGISIRFMNSNAEGDHLKSAVDVTNYIQQIKFNGYTPLGSGLETNITITDGEPTGPGERMETTRNVIIRAKEYLSTLPYGAGSIAFMFAQVGKDQSAQAFLGQLDRDPQVGSMIDCVSDYELEQEEYKRKGIDLTPEVYLVKLMIGACDRSYDEGDE